MAGFTQTGKGADLEFFIYRDGVLVASGTFNGSRAIPYNPPDGPGTYVIKTNAAGTSPRPTTGIDNRAYHAWTRERTCLIQAFFR